MSSTPYFSSRQRSTFTLPSPNYQAAARGNQNELLRALKGVGTRLTAIETRVGGGSINLKTNSPVSTPPPPAQFGVTAGSGVFRVQITNPQFTGKGNLPHTPIQHRITFSSTSDFRSSDTYPIGNQTYYEISKYPTGSRKWLKIDSSYDGHQFNQAQILGPYQA